MELAPHDLQEIDSTASEIEIQGSRYPGALGQADGSLSKSADWWQCTDTSTLVSPAVLRI